MTNGSEWMTLAELVDMFGLSMFKVRTTIAALRTTGAITTRERPTDKRVLEIHRDSLSVIKNALANSPKDNEVMPEKKPIMPNGFSIKQDDKRLISVQETIEKYDLDRDWINHNLTRIRFPGNSTLYIFLPELEFVINQPEIIPPGQEA